MNDLTPKKYEYSYSLMTVMGSDGDKEYSKIYYKTLVNPLEKSNKNENSQNVTK